VDLAAVRPVTLAGDQCVDVAPALSGVVPGALRRGTTVAVTGGAGATSLAFALGSVASAGGAWVAAVGLPDLGLAAVSELGVDLDRLVAVDPPRASWATVVAALLDSVEIVYARPPLRVRAADARRLAARARERGAVLVVLGSWPEAPDLSLQVASGSWVGPATGGGAGHLSRRLVEVVATGRGAASRERRAQLWLPGPGGGVLGYESRAQRMRSLPQNVEPDVSSANSA
jgi:hypothetical protein